MTKTPTAPWWNFAAVVIALISVAAGYGFVNASVSASPTAENYFAQLELRRTLRGVMMLVSMFAPLVAIVIGAIGRSALGMLAGFLAAAFSVFWVPAHTRACCGSDVSRIVGMMRAINSAQQAYASACSNSKGFANSLDTLSRPPVPGSSPFLPSELSQGLWGGYRVTMQIPQGAEVDFIACDGRRVVSAYFVEAHPIEADATRPNFATDERGTVYQRRDGTTIQPGMAGAEPVF